MAIHRSDPSGGSSAGCDRHDGVCNDNKTESAVDRRCYGKAQKHKRRYLRVEVQSDVPDVLDLRL